eukprot:COSAG01_NODE_1633_length_9666_cov_569.421135_4_plen_120_part_00
MGGPAGCTDAPAALSSGVWRSAGGRKTGGGGAFDLARRGRRRCIAGDSSAAARRGASASHLLEPVVQHACETSPLQPPHDLMNSSSVLVREGVTEGGRGPVGGHSWREAARGTSPAAPS